MTTQEEVEAIHELDALYVRQRDSGRAEDIEQYTAALWTFQLRRAGLEPEQEGEAA